MSDRKGTGLALLACALIAVAAFAAYGRTFSFPFVFDAAAIIANNPTLRHLGAALHPPHDGSTVDGRPLVNLSLALNYAVSGMAVGSYHAFNLIVHLLAGWTLFGLVRRTMRGPAPGAVAMAFAIALLWVVHPLQTESVTYVIQRAESLAGLLYLLTLYSFVRYAADAPAVTDPSGLSRRGWAVLSVLACLLGTATKEIIVTAPVVVLLYDRTFLSGSFRQAWRRHRVVHLALAATWIPLGLLVLSTAGRNGTAGFGIDLGWWDYARTQAYAVAHYLRLAFWPAPLVFDYGATLLPPGRWIASAFVLLALAAGTVRGLISRGPRLRTAGFLGFCFFAILAPTSLVPVATQTMAEHRMYLPLAAVIAAVVLGLSQVLRRPLGLVVVVSGLAAGLAAATARRNEAYRSEEALWTDTVAKEPANDRAHNNLGNAFFLEGRLPEALAQYEEALRLRPRDNAEVQYNLGNTLLQEGRLPEAIAHGAEAVRLAPANPNARNGLGTALARSGRLSEAREQFQAALALDPSSAVIHSNLGSTWLLLGRRAEAAAEYREALRLDPNYGDAREALSHLDGVSGSPPGTP